MGKLIVRVDDYPCVKKEELEKHSWNRFAMFDQVLSSGGIRSYILGVIPSLVIGEDLRKILSNRRIELAQHGVSHDETRQNEFQPYVTERQMVGYLRGWNGFESCTVYIPPHNVIDVRTCRALLSCGFKTIMTGPETDPLVISYARQIGLDVLHSNKPYEYGRSDEMSSMGSPSVISQRLRDGKDVVLTLHWTWENNIGYDHLEDFLKELWFTGAIE